MQLWTWASGDPQLGWNVADDIRELFAYPFMVSAFRAGTIVAVVAAVIGWFMVVRRQTFAGHALGVIGFPGAAGAVLLGWSATVGLFVFCISAALVIAVVPGRGGGDRAGESALIGVVQAFALACGFLFLSLQHGSVSSTTALLFGSFLGITESQVVLLAVVAVAVLAVLAAIGRPLLFASVDEAVARAHGVPVRGLSVVFLVVLGAAVAEVSQITGSLLVFTLLVLPAATAQVLTPRPARQIAASVGLALAVTWTGLVGAYYSAQPIGFWVSSVAFGAYVVARVGRAVRDRRIRRPGSKTTGVAPTPRGAPGAGLDGATT